MGGKSSTSTSTVQIPPEVLARYNAVNAQAQNVSQTPFQPYSFDPSAFVAPFTPTQMAGLTGTNYYAGAAQPYYGAATQQLEQTQAGVQPLNTAAQGLTLAGAGPANLGQLQTQRYMSPYMSDVVGTMLRAQQMQNAQQASQLQGQAIQAGAFGGDRSGIAAANLAYQQNLANQQALAGALQSGYTQAQNVAQQQQGAQLAAQQANLQRLTGAGQQLGALGQTQYGQGAATSQQLAALGAGAQQAGLSGAQAQLAAGQAQQQTAQQGLAALYNQFLQQQAYPFQTTQFLANIAEGTGALSGSTTSTTQPSSFFSDERLKDDIEPIGETYDGQKIVKFRYKGHPEKQIGLVAQDVERHHPDAVGLAGGYKTVDYDRATRDAADMGHQSEGGAVTPERYGLGFAEGGANDNAMFRDAAAGGGLMGGDDYSRMLAAQQAMYEGLPWAKQGMPMGGMPGGAGLNIPTGGGHTPQLVTAKAAPPGQTGLQQLQGAVQTGEAIGKGYGQIQAGLQGAEKAYDWLTSPSTDALKAMTAGPSNVADTGLLVGGVYRGGRINYADGGMPYDDNSGYMGKLGDADEPKKAPELHPAQGPGQAGSSGLSNVASLVGIGSGIANLAPKIASGIEYLAPLLALKDGGVAGRHGYASDGAVDDTVPDDDYLNLISRQAQGLAPPSSGMPSVTARQPAPNAGDDRVISLARQVADWWNRPRETEISEQVGPTGMPVYTSRPSTEPAPPAGGVAPTSTEENLPVPPIPPSAPPAQAPSGLAPLKEVSVGEWPVPPSRPDQGGVAAGEPARPVTTAAAPTGVTPFTPPETRGGASDWMKRNQDWLVPLLSGIGGMASSPSRYLGAAALQGLGAAANAYQGTQTALAQREQTEAMAGQLRVGAAGKAFQYIPNFGYAALTIDPQTGNVVPILMDQYKELVRQGRAPTLVGQAPTQGNAPPTAVPPTPAQPPILGVNYDDAARQAAQRDLASVTNIQIPGGETGIMEASKEAYKNILNGAESARVSRAPSIQLMTALSANPNTNILTVPGWGNANRAQLSNVLDTVARAFGVAGGENGYNFGEAASDEAISNKINTLNAGMRAHGAGEKAFGALQAYMAASPNRSMEPKAAAELAAQLMVAQQRQIDQNAFAASYMRDSSNILGPNFNQAFDTNHPSEKYQAEAETLKQLMLNPVGRQIFQVYTSGRATPAQMETILTAARAPRGIGRYFGAGG